MTDPTSFSVNSPRFSLPLLFSGQSQKEATVNEALLLADMLLHPVVQGIVTVAPTAPAIGQSWLVGAGAAGSFAGHDDSIAVWSEGGWRFAKPVPGMRIYDVGLACHRIWTGIWRFAASPAAPSGGAVVDTQARNALAALIALLKDAAIISTT